MTGPACPVPGAGWARPGQVGLRRALPVCAALVLGAALVVAGWLTLDTAGHPGSAATLAAAAGPSGGLVAASAVAGPVAPAVGVPVPPDPGADPDADDDPTISFEVNGPDGSPNSAIVVLLAVTALSVSPALLLLMTSFTKIIVVLSLTRNALGLQTSPPTQVLTGLALFLTVFVMGPVLSEINDVALQPYLDGALELQEAVDAGVVPLREFMLAHTRSEELALVTQAADLPLPDSRDEVPLTTLVPAFVLSELRSAFIIGFVIFVPFVVIDLVVSAALMSMGVMMLPPIVISLPFKLLLFVLVDGWGLVVTALVGSYTT